LHEGFGPHYFVDKDGQIVKMLPDSAPGRHAKGCLWMGLEVNSRSFGIEIINHDEDFEPVQYQSLLWLINDLRSAHPTIPAWNLIGHTDVDTHRDPVEGYDPFKGGWKTVTKIKKGKKTQEQVRIKPWLKRGKQKNGHAGHIHWVEMRDEDPGKQFDWTF